MRFLWFSTIFIAFLGVLIADSADLTTEIEKADKLYDDNKFMQAYKALKALDQEDAEVLWRMGRNLFKASDTEKNNAKRTEMIHQAFKYISDSLEKKEDNFNVHAWYAILLDAKSNLVGIKERITQLEVVKKHMLRAVELNPKDPTSRYLLGEFAFGLADLPWYQRAIVTAIFAAPPTGTYQEALEHFLQAEALEPDFYSMNKLMIGKCYYQLSNYKKAKEYLTKAAAITVLNEDDRKCKAEASKLLRRV
jgi:tetratricopeptide (TPR) repeat protein